MNIIIIVPNPDISTNPTLINLVRRLADDGVFIDIFQPASQTFLPLDITSNKVKLHNYVFSSFRRTINSDMLTGLPGKFTLFNQLKRKKETVVLAVDPRGVVEAYRFCKWLKVPFLYISFEIFFMDELHLGEHKRLKKKEIEASQHAALTIIQDEKRGALLAEENNISLGKMFYLPVSPSSSSPVKRSDYLRKKFNIPPDKTIVLYSGSFCRWSYAEELLKNTKYWPKDFVLVVHMRILKDYEKELIKDYDVNNVFYSIEQYNFTDYLKILSSAHIGLPLYNPRYESPYDGKNIKTIGLSSGKFSCYMRFGLPTISINQHTYKEILPEYNFGLDIENIDQLPKALSIIKDNYTSFSEEASRLFKEVLDFEIYYPKLIKKIHSLYNKYPNQSAPKEQLMI